MNQGNANPQKAVFFALDRDLARSSPSISVVTTFFNEEGNVRAVIDEINSVLSNLDYEIIAVDDGSTDGTAGALTAARKVHPRLRVIRHGRNAGKSRAVRTGALAARGGVIATMDGDGQNDPADILALLEEFERVCAQGVVMIAGERMTREDTARKKLASRLANSVRRRILKDGAADTGCGLKLFRRDAYLRLPYFDNMHRYLPALMRREGFGVAFAPVKDRPRAHGRSKYTNWGRFLVGIVDLAGVFWLMARARRPESVDEERE